MTNTDLNMGNSRYRYVNLGYASGVMAFTVTAMGEPGYSLYVPSDHALHLYDKIMSVRNLNTLVFFFTFFEFSRHLLTSVFFSARSATSTVSRTSATWRCVTTVSRSSSPSGGRSLRPRPRPSRLARCRRSSWTSPSTSSGRRRLRSSWRAGSHRSWSSSNAPASRWRRTCTRGEVRDCRTQWKHADKGQI